MTKQQQKMADQMLARDAEYILRPWSGSGEPVPIVDARGCVVTDADGKSFLDFTTGYFVNQAGHCNPRVMKAAAEQLGKVTQVSGRHTTLPVIDLAERLVKLSPPSLTKTFYCTGGSEANEHALKMARQQSKKRDVCVLDNAYHGLTLGVLGGCAAKSYRDTAGIELQDTFFSIPHPYCYRCKHQDDCATQCLDGVEKTLDDRPNTAALLAEPIQAVGGIIPPQNWWERLEKIRKRRNLLLILDEIQTGIGRTGKMFGAEHYGLEPDFMTIGKGVSGGVGSLAAVLARGELVTDFYAGTTPTSAGNAVSAAAGVALIDTLIDEKLVENCAAMGEHFTGAVAELGDPWVGEIRFKGLLGGVELVLDRDSKQVLPGPLVAGVKDALHEDGMLLTVSGPLKNVLRLQPPLSITSKQIDAFVASLGRALSAIRAGNAKGMTG